MCYDFDLCADCYEGGETGTGRHSSLHPVQCILTRVDAGEGGEGRGGGEGGGGGGGGGEGEGSESPCES